jgi:phage-related protein
VVQSFLGVVVMLWDTQFRTILNIVQVALQLLTGDFEGAGQTLQSILNDWHIFFESTIRTITNGIRQWFQGVDWGGIGYAILQGIANGISNGAGMIADAARQAAQSAFEAAKNFLGIHSPSKLAAQEIGAPFAQGIGVGITDALGRVSGQVAAGLDGMMGGLSAGITPIGAGAGGAGVTVVQNFYGPTDAATVQGAAQSGVLAALRAAGRR